MLPEAIASVRRKYLLLRRFPAAEDTMVLVQVQSELSMAYLQEFYTVCSILFGLIMYVYELFPTMLPSCMTSVLIVRVMCYLQTVRDKCFEKCVTKPSSSLGSSEQQCLARCCDRYAEVSGKPIF